MDITKNITLTEGQSVNIVGFDMKRVRFGPKENWVANITFQVKNEQGMKLYDKVVQISPSEWNQFWAEFNNGKFLYQNYLVNETIPESVEDEFLNS
jgi:hypothetical protein